MFGGREGALPSRIGSDEKAMRDWLQGKWWSADGMADGRRERDVNSFNNNAEKP